MDSTRSTRLLPICGTKIVLRAFLDEIDQHDKGDEFCQSRFPTAKV